MVREWVFVGARIAFEGRGTMVDGMVAVLRRSLASEKLLALGLYVCSVLGAYPA